MSFDFPTFLVAATFLTGGIWLLDALLFAPKRRRRLAAGAEAQSGGYKEPVLVEYARSFFPVILVVLLLRSFIVEPFRIPSGSMMPTLLVGDFILVNKFSYGLRWPVLNKQFVDIGTPERGDVMVFRFPRDESVDYIKRVIAVPGDRVDYRDKTLYVNGEPLEQTLLGDYVDENGQPTGLIEVVEEVDDEHEHAILINPRTGDFPRSCGVLARGPVTVPEGEYFVMGDNRDNSNDGRCWGFVPEENLVGKAFAIWMSWDGNRDGLPIAFERIGDVIH
jgi:signal peptidase I